MKHVRIYLFLILWVTMHISAVTDRGHNKISHRSPEHPDLHHELVIVAGQERRTTENEPEEEMYLPSPHLPEHEDAIDYPTHSPND